MAHDTDIVMNDSKFYVDEEVVFAGARWSVEDVSWSCLKNSWVYDLMSDHLGEVFDIYEELMS